ncbi:hypothetical protein EWM64_g7539 [Hericium alpestre]|uniref:tRNA-5-taurinomethyluridine 2-sulfurtransferase n=1 Tax=Hericium alpestre TaxID=135208 RepID=A0A4Y9ZR17_9AGAM|nr:hypothetical protein EWM64_g7539 [Hericium alpestre]
MGICFVGEKRKFTDFLGKGAFFHGWTVADERRGAGDYIPPRPGPIRELDTGRTLGEHQGLWTYTIGQGAKIKGMPQRMFVVRKDKARNEIWVAPSTHADLLAAGVSVRDWSWIWENGAPEALDALGGLHARMQFRHRMAEVGCIIRRGSGEHELTITFDEPQKAVALGQIAAVWSDDVCLGCGTIVDVDPMPQ